MGTRSKPGWLVNQQHMIDRHLSSFCPEGVCAELLGSLVKDESFFSAEESSPGFPLAPPDLFHAAEVNVTGARRWITRCHIAHHLQSAAIWTHHQDAVPICMKPARSCKKDNGRVTGYQKRFNSSLCRL